MIADENSNSSSDHICGVAVADPPVDEAVLEHGEPTLVVVVSSHESNDPGRHGLQDALTLEMLNARRRAVGLEALVGPIVNGGRPWDIASRTLDSHVLVFVIRSGQPHFAGLSGTAGQASEAGPDPPTQKTFNRINK